VLRVSEIYTSVQGEGPNVGRPTVFVRFAGCNYRCPGWPCDTPHAIFPEIFKKEQKLYEPKDLEIEVDKHYPASVTITGGEPFIQKAKDLEGFAEHLLERRYSIDVFTNGSILFPLWTHSPRVTMIMDWKLKGSGEADKNLVERRKNRLTLGRKDAVKFVAKDRSDLVEAKWLMDAWGVPQHQVFFGRAWDCELKDSDIVDFMAKHELYFVKLNLQVHKYIWDPSARRT
jgi:7-carboxy-7-deazaguanine synthase